MPDDTLPAQLHGPIVEQAVTLPTSRDVVWQLITSPAGVKAWYTVGGGAEIAPKVGTPVKLWWEADTTFLGRVVTVEEPRRFDYRLAHGVNVTPGTVPSTLVQFLVVEAPGDPAHTVVTVRESGFRDLEDPKESYTASTMAWIGAFGLLQQVVTQLNAARADQGGADKGGAD